MIGEALCILWNMIVTLFKGLLKIGCKLLPVFNINNIVGNIPFCIGYENMV